MRQQNGDINGIAQISDMLGLFYFLKLNLVEKAIHLLMQSYNLYQKIGSSEKKSPMDALNNIESIIGREKFNQIVQSSVAKGDTIKAGQDFHLGDDTTSG